jgi:uncharacterized protein YceK
MRRATVLASVLSLALAGCGTVCNLAGDSPGTYGGTRKDLDWINEANNHPSRGNAAFWIDLPMSFAADTLTLPLAAFLRDRRAPPADGETPPEEPAR